MHPAIARALGLLFLLPTAAPAQEPAAFQTVFDQIKALAPRKDRVATVKDLVLRRDAAEFRLTSGTLHLLTPVAGRTVGAVFLGTGSVTLTPPLPVERAEIIRVLKDSLVQTPITAAVFIFTDSTAAELERRATFAPAAIPGGVTSALDAALDFLMEPKKLWVEPALMSELLNQGADSAAFFSGFVRPVKGGDLMIQVNPHEIEEIRLLRRGKFPGQRTQTVSQFQNAAGVRDSVNASDELPDRLLLESYAIESTIKDNWAFSAVATVRLKGRRDGNRWARFSLYEDLQVDSVLSDAGARLTFVRAKQSEDLWVRFDPTIDAGAARAFRVAYHGDLIGHGSLIQQFIPPNSNPAAAKMRAEAMDRWAFIKSTGGWFPRYGVDPPAVMELIFHTPARDRFSSIGKLAESKVEGAVRTTRWVTEVPTRQASFNIGELEEFDIRDPRIPPVTVQMNTDAHVYLANLFGFGQRDPKQQVAGDVASSLAFFTNVFGQPLFKHYYATEIPYGHGQAFPGLIHLSWWTFQSVSETGEDEIFRAHEMAHQWWGIGVETADYRDAWLAEGFSDFAGMWYMQLILNDNEKYFKQLADWATQIRAARNDAPPTALGYRVAQLDPEHYQLMIYRKGAWVVHMLRNMLIEFTTMKEDKFSAMMKDYYTTYRGKSSTTREFQRVVEKHTGVPMDWFFDQWVSGTSIPTYTLSWKTDPAPDGKFLFKFRVRQENVPGNFIMPVPLLIELADKSQVIIRVNVRGARAEGELSLAGKPVRVELNPLQSVLAEIRQEGWRQ